MNLLTDPLFIVQVAEVADPCLVFNLHAANFDDLDSIISRYAAKYILTIVDCL